MRARILDKEQEVSLPLGTIRTAVRLKFGLDSTAVSMMKTVTVHLMTQMEVDLLTMTMGAVTEEGRHAVREGKSAKISGRDTCHGDLCVRRP